MTLCDKIKSFPRRPGVYLFKGEKGEVLYVGKAKVLRDRIRSYFGKSAEARPQVKFLIKRSRDLDFIVTDTEKEALFLENTLIKKHKPKYNFDLKDDKSYISIRLGLEHEYPSITTTRNIKKDGAAYFGPYDSSLAAKEAVEQIVRFFKIRSCKDREFSNRIRPCLEYDMGRCTAPCVKIVSKREYKEQLEEARLFLIGKSAELIDRLDRKMKAASCDMRYEDAARLRDAILRLRDLLKKQKAVSHFGGDHDAVAIASENGMVSACVLKVRAGILTDRKAYFSASTIGNDRELMREFLARYYTQTDDVPSRIFTTTPSDDLNDVVELINKKVSGGLLKISKPIRGEMKRLVVLAKTNAAEFLEHKKSRRGETEVLLNIGLKLGLGGAPELIDCVDISNLNGREAVGSVVSFRDGMPDKSRFRTYNIKTLHTPDDYAMMREVLTRRYGENISLPLPDLLLVDGGKGHLSVAMKVMKDGQIPLSLAAIAKGKKEGECDRIFIPNRKNPLNFKASSGELLFLMRIRDEAHRFGINAHRRMRSRKAIKT